MVFKQPTGSNVSAIKISTNQKYVLSLLGCITGHFSSLFSFTKVKPSLPNCFPLLHTIPTRFLYYQASEYWTSVVYRNGDLKSYHSPIAHISTSVGVRNPNVLLFSFRMSKFSKPFENQTFYHSKTELWLA